MILRESATLTAVAMLIALSSNARADGDILIPPGPSLKSGIVWCVSPLGKDWETKERCRYIGGLWLGWNEDNLREMPGLGDTSSDENAHIGGAGSSNAVMVRKAQAKLHSIGVYDGKTDGIASPKTIEAVRAFQVRVGRDPTGIIDDELVRAMDEVLSLTSDAAQDQKVGAETSKLAKSNLQRPRQPPMPPSRSAAPDVVSQLAAMIKSSNLSDRQKMIIQVASVLGTGEFCLHQGVDYRDVADAMIAGWRANSLSDDLPTRMSIDFGVQIGHEGRIYDFDEGIIIDLGTIPDTRSKCGFIHREVVRISELNEKAAPPAAPAPRDQGLAQGEKTSASNPSQAPQTKVPESVSIGGSVETAHSDMGSATSMQSGKGAAGAAARLSDDTLAALLRRGDELLALGDLSAARLFYERAAMGGSARAATAVGTTYDPMFFEDSRVRGARPDTVKALAWYRNAMELGDREAAARLKKLESFAGQ